LKIQVLGQVGLRLTSIPVWQVFVWGKNGITGLLAERVTAAAAAAAAGEVLLNLLRAHTAAYRAIRALPNGGEFKVRH
jgi:hypothetical protein